MSDAVGNETYPRGPPTCHHGDSASPLGGGSVSRANGSPRVIMGVPTSRRWHVSLAPAAGSSVRKEHSNAAVSVPEVYYIPAKRCQLFDKAHSFYAPHRHSRRLRLCFPVGLC